MSKMPLSEAIRLGSLTLPDPTAGDISRCAIHMALAANATVPDAADLADGWPGVHKSDGDAEQQEEDENEHLPMRFSEMGSENWRLTLAAHVTLLEMYSWIDKIFPCAWCQQSLQGTEIVHHPFDRHVIPGEITMDAFCSWIAAIESPPECYGHSLDVGLSVRFQDSSEKNAVLRAAAKLRIRSDDYIAAAVRFIIEQNLVLPDDCIRAAPLVGTGQDVNYSPKFESSGQPRQIP